MTVYWARVRYVLTGREVRLQFGTATERALALISIATRADVLAEGVDDHWTCSVCGKAFTPADGEYSRCSNCAAASAEAGEIATGTE